MKTARFSDGDLVKSTSLLIEIFQNNMVSTQIPLVSWLVCFLFLCCLKLITAFQIFFICHWFHFIFEMLGFSMNYNVYNQVKKYQPL